MPATIVQTNPTPFAEVAIDPVTLDIIENALRNARVEMDTTLVRTAMSSGIREQGDAFPLIAYTSMFGHQSDIGGKVAGSMPIDATSIFQEGVRIPPVKIWKQGVYNEDLIALVMHQTRTPEWCKADLNALIAACRVAARRVSRWRRGSATTCSSRPGFVAQLPMGLMQTLFQITMRCGQYWVCRFGRID